MYAARKPQAVTQYNFGAETTDADDVVTLLSQFWQVPGDISSRDPDSWRTQWNVHPSDSTEVPPWSICHRESVSIAYHPSKHETFI